MPGGAMRSLEMPGAESLSTWRECWAVFRTAATMLSVAHAGSWIAMRPCSWIGVRGSSTRGTFAHRQTFVAGLKSWVTERWAQEEFHSSHPDLSAFSPTMPWDSVIKSSANDTELWD